MTKAWKNVSEVLCRDVGSAGPELLYIEDIQQLVLSETQLKASDQAALYFLWRTKEHICYTAGTAHYMTNIIPVTVVLEASDRNLPDV